MTKRKVDLGGENSKGLTHNPFAALQRAPGGGARSEQHEPGEPPAAPAGGAGQPRVQAVHWLVRKERKGRGGKVVTIVSPLAGSGVEDLGALARALGQGLGTGARAKDGAVVVQGELSERVAQFLEAAGAKVTVGS